MDALRLKKDLVGETLRATRPYRSGDIVLDFAEVEWRPVRDHDTVRHPSGSHLFHPALAKASRNRPPNCRLDLTGRVLVAVRSIAIGEAISFDQQMAETRPPMPDYISAARAFAAAGSDEDPEAEGPTMSMKDPDQSPCDDLLARRRRTFIRDWILVVIAVGLAIAAGMFRSGHSRIEAARTAAASALVR